VWVVVNTVVPVFGVIAIGFWLAGRRDLHVPTLADLALLVTSPALVFSVMSRTALEADRWATLLGASFWIVAGTALLALVYVRTQGIGPRAFLPPTLFWNAGNMALPCAHLAFGEEGLEAGVIIYVVIAILQFTVGVGIAKGEGGVREAFRMPLLYGAAGGLLVSATGLELPRAIREPVDMVGAMAIPLMLLNLGIQLRLLRVTDVRHSAVSVGIRMGGGLVFGLLFVTLLGVGGVERQVILLGSIMPAAVVNVVIAQRYGSDANLVASAIVLGTIVSAAAIPTLLFFVT
jgi:predicted permease